MSTSEHPAVVAPVDAPAQPARKRRSPLSYLGFLVSIVSLAAVAWWASKQQAPQLPHTGAEIFDLVLAIALYGVATVVRGERWQRLLADEGGSPPRKDTYALTVIGYMGNNVLPARGGDLIRIFLMAAPAGVNKRSVTGTLVAERILDVAVLLVLFVVVGGGLLGDVSVKTVGFIAAGVIVLGLAAAAGWRFVVRNAKLHDMLAPFASATLSLRKAHHGPVLLGMTLVIWAIETGVWMSVGGAVGFGMTPIEGCYLVALASVFSMIPSGPAYAGTQDTAVAVGIKALGGTGGTAVAYLLMIRFVIVVPITLVGLVLMVVRYGGLKKLREARA